MGDILLDPTLLDSVGAGISNAFRGAPRVQVNVAGCMADDVTEAASELGSEIREFVSTLEQGAGSLGRSATAIAGAFRSLDKALMSS